MRKDELIEQIKNLNQEIFDILCVGIDKSRGLYGENKIQFIFNDIESTLNGLNLPNNSNVITGYGHAIRVIVALSEIYIKLGGNINAINDGIRLLVYQLATLNMKGLASFGTQLKCSKDLSRMLLNKPIYKIPYQSDHFEIRDGKLVFNRALDESYVHTKKNNPGKCPAINIREHNEGLIDQLLRNISQSYS